VYAHRFRVWHGCNGTLLEGVDELVEALRVHEAADRAVGIRALHRDHGLLVDGALEMLAVGESALGTNHKRALGEGAANETRQQ
jgi:hypothetical protein